MLTTVIGIFRPSAPRAKPFGREIIYFHKEDNYYFRGRAKWYINCRKQKSTRKICPTPLHYNTKIKYSYRVFLTVFLSTNSCYTKQIYMIKHEFKKYTYFFHKSQVFLKDFLRRKCKCTFPIIELNVTYIYSLNGCFFNNFQPFSNTKNYYYFFQTINLCILFICF